MLTGSDRILITGGAGLVGSHIADLLVKQFDPEIVIVDNFTAGKRENLRWALGHGRVEVVDGDVRDAELVHDVMSGVDIVFHQTAVRSVQCVEDPRLALEVMADGTFNVLEAATLNRVKKIVAASAASIYGLAEEFPTPETHHPYNNRTLYGTAKAFNEGLLRSFHEMYGLDYIALRYFNIYGPRMDANGSSTEVMIRWMNRIALRQPCLIVGDGKQTMDFVYVEDIARANILAAASDATDEVFNIASGCETSLNELAATLGRVMGCSIPPQHGRETKANSFLRRLADISKAQRMLGFRTQVPLEEGLRRLVSWWERQRALEAAVV